MVDALVVRSLTAPEIQERLAELSDLLIDCVEGGASVGFMWPFGREKADAFWRGVEARVAAGRHVVLVAEASGTVLGSAQLAMELPENQPHRAEVAKVLVHSTARRRGLGRALMAAVEDQARAAGRTLLVLDAVTGGAGERLYAGLGWTVVGQVPGYALFPDGRSCATTIFYKDLRPSPAP